MHVGSTADGYLVVVGVILLVVLGMVLGVVLGVGLGVVQGVVLKILLSSKAISCMDGWNGWMENEHCNAVLIKSNRHPASLEIAF